MRVVVVYLCLFMFPGRKQPIVQSGTAVLAHPDSQSERGLHLPADQAGGSESTG